MLISFIFLLGTVIGSFLNVCIYRMPLSQSVVKPRSYCPHCKKRIAWYDNIPFLSFIFLGGRCRFCKNQISLRYFIVELITASAFVLLYWRYGLSFNFFYYSIFLCGLIIATFVDIQHRIIPDEISIGGVIVGLILNIVRVFVLRASNYGFQTILDSLLGIIVGGGIIFLSGYLFDLVYFKLLKKPAIDGETASMGGGDVKLLAMIGAFLGWQNALLTFFIAPFFGVVIGIFNLIFKKEHTIAYGPFLCLGAIVSWYWADKILSFLLLRY
ncbi:MAG: prepilin peptidase [Candidatus Omnitrophota bacterium]|nr:prepilin peptidase [Candidatus Omnitrophota bacterium]